MKLVIFGATGRTGVPLVEQALDAGHEVVGFVRSADKMNIQHKCLRLVEGDVMQANDVNRAITSDIDAVISTLGPVKDSPEAMMGTAADNIIKAMEAHRVKRLIWMTGAGVSALEDKPGLFDHFIKFMLKTLQPAVLKQSEEAVERVRVSKLDWTVVRGPMLTDGEHTGNYRVGYVGVGTGPRLSRADAADFMLAQVNSTDYLHKAPVLSN
jgi:putative NADH-flavin reductase